MTQLCFALRRSYTLYTVITPETGTIQPDIPPVVLQGFVSVGNPKTYSLANVNTVIVGVPINSGEHAGKILDIDQHDIRVSIPNAPDIKPRQARLIL